MLKPARRPVGLAEAAIRRSASANPSAADLGCRYLPRLCGRAAEALSCRAAPNEGPPTEAAYRVRRCCCFRGPTRKYFMRKAPWRAGSGPPQRRHVTSRYSIAVGASMRTSLYFASQRGQFICDGGGAMGRSMLTGPQRFNVARQKTPPLGMGALSPEWISITSFS